MNARTESVLFGSFISLAFTHCDASFRPPFFISPNHLLLMSEKKKSKVPVFDDFDNEKQGDYALISSAAVLNGGKG